MSVPRWSHTFVQWMLLDIGRRTHHDVWVATGDRNRRIGPVRLGDVCLSRLPTFASAQVRAIMERIDVIWFRSGRPNPCALFEVEHSTSIVTGLMRMNDLLLTLPSPVAGWQMTVVAPARRIGRFQSELARPTFRATGLADRCRFMGYDELLARHRAVTGLPA